MASTATESKIALRVQVLSARRARSAAARARAGLAIADRAPAAWARPLTVAAYAGVGTEPPTRPLLDRLLRQGAQVLLPVVTAEGLDWSSYRSWDELARSPLGLLEPTGPRLGHLAIGSAGLIVVPALAVDGAGHRLGRGGGFYDRALRLAGNATVVAVLYDEEVVSSVPVEPHDRVVQAVLTPTGLVTVGGETPPSDCESRQ